MKNKIFIFFGIFLLILNSTLVNLLPFFLCLEFMLQLNKDKIKTKINNTLKKYNNLL